MPRYTLRMRSPQHGLTLIELMVALAIGMFLMIGAVTVFMQGRSAFRVMESLSRLQENARFALDLMEPDLRMAGHYGLTNVGANIVGRAPVTLSGGLAACGNTWVNDFERPVVGSDGSVPWPWPACTGRAPVETSSDTLVVRRVSEDAATTRSAGTLYLQSNRSGTAKSELFIGAMLPSSPAPTTSQPFRVIANGYYVSRTSDLTVTGADANTVPSLRMKSLIEGGSIVDRELVPGVEDLQIQLGLDTTPPEAAAGRGTIDRFVGPNDALVAGAAFRTDERLILAVRVWLRVRAERTERGYLDDRTYTYAGQTVGPFNDGYRRFVISKTIYLRNGNRR